MVTFEEYLELHEGLAGDAMGYLIKFLRTTRDAGVSQYQDTHEAIQILKQKLESILGNAKHPTPAQLKAAWDAVGDIPKIGILIVSLFAPMPGLFTALIFVAVAIKRVFGISILPKHFDRAYLSGWEREE